VKQVIIRRGAICTENVPTPFAGPKNILVRVDYSCISAGTEMAGIKASGVPLHRRVLKKPALVGCFFKKIHEEGLERTQKALRGELDPGSASGYSAAGTVVAVGEEVRLFSPGDRVACAGAGIANHAEYIDVPVNLAVKIPDALGTDLASTVTLGAIALQGVRRAAPTLGESIAVIGLGLLGQLTVQLLKACGCRVIGTDLDQKRVDLALALGMDHAAPADPDQFVRYVERETGRFGADASIIAAAAPSHEIVSQAMRACRKKGRLVLVGDVGLNLKREDFYVKELDFFISTSYGPGRYDPVYEVEGQDYPIAYVRWTENRNMEEYLRLLSEKILDVSPLMCGVYEIDQAAEAYAALQRGESMLVLLSYPETTAPPQRVVAMWPPRAAQGKIRVALAGAGDFAMGMHLPNMLKLRKSFQLRTVMSRTAVKARAAAKRFEAEHATTDYQAVLNDADVDLVFITTRHDTHGDMVISALRAGKHVFVEKPLCLREEELSAIEQFYQETANPPVLMTGFNRRFSPAFVRVRELLTTRSAPFMLEYRMNAGYLPPEHWVHGPQGGGRNIGESCHIYDLFVSLAGPDLKEVKAMSIKPPSAQWQRNDNFTASVSFADGSVCTLLYTALGDTSYSKEQMHVYSDNSVLVLNNYISLEVHGRSEQGWSAKNVEKGHFEELQALARTLVNGEPWPISLQEQLAATRISFEVERQILGKAEQHDSANL